MYVTLILLSGCLLQGAIVTFLVGARAVEVHHPKADLRESDLQPIDCVCQGLFSICTV